MSRDIADLVPSFRDEAEELLQRCEKRGARYVPFFTLRDPFTQARLYRQSRSTARVEATMARLERDGAPFLAECLRVVGPQPTAPWRTNAVPGLSWHQHGLAIDVYRERDVDGDGIMDADWRPVMYQPLISEAENMGLTSLASIGDPVHVQQPAGSVTDTLPLPEIDARMFDRFRVQYEELSR